jgi:hypothetical protein
LAPSIGTIQCSSFFGNGKVGMGPSLGPLPLDVTVENPRWEEALDVTVENPRWEEAVGGDNLITENSSRRRLP